MLIRLYTISVIDCIHSITNSCKFFLYQPGVACLHQLCLFIITTLNIKENKNSEVLDSLGFGVCPLYALKFSTSRVASSHWVPYV